MKKTVYLVSLFLVLALLSALLPAALAEDADALSGYWRYDKNSPMSDVYMAELFGNMPDFCFRPDGRVMVFYNGQEKDTLYTWDESGRILVSIGDDHWLFRQTGDLLYLSVPFFDTYVFLPYARIASAPEDVTKESFAGFYSLVLANGQDTSWLFTPGGMMLPYVGFDPDDVPDPFSYEIRDGFLLVNGAYFAALTDNGAVHLESGNDLFLYEPYRDFEARVGGFIDPAETTLEGYYESVIDSYTVGLLLLPDGHCIEMMTRHRTGVTQYRHKTYRLDGEVIRLGSDYMLCTPTGLVKLTSKIYQKTASYEDYMNAHGGVLSRESVLGAIDGLYTSDDGTNYLLTTSGHTVSAKTHGSVYGFTWSDIAVTDNLAVISDTSSALLLDGEVIFIDTPLWKNGQRLSSAEEYLESIGATGTAAFDPEVLSGTWQLRAEPDFYCSLDTVLTFDAAQGLVETQKGSTFRYAVLGNSVWLYDTGSSPTTAYRLTMTNGILSFTEELSDRSEELMYSKRKMDQSFEYIVNDEGEVTITAWRPTEEREAVNLAIPPMLDGHPVAHLSEDLFRGCASLRTLVLPEGLRTVGNSCFRGCENLLYLELPSTLEYFGDRAVYECPLLTELRLPEGISNVNDAF